MLVPALRQNQGVEAVGFVLRQGWNGGQGQNTDGERGRAVVSKMFSFHCDDIAVTACKNQAA